MKKKHLENVPCFPRKLGKKQHQRCFMLPFGKKRGIISEYLPWMILAISVLAILMISIFILRGKGLSLIDKIKDLFQFG